MRGKYSPTVSEAYLQDQDWWRRYSEAANEYVQFDPEGFDMYGYDENDMDRAGNSEDDYMHDDDDGSGRNWAYEYALSDWTYDGVKPVKV